MPEKKLGTSRISLRSALNTAHFVWPEFVSVHGLVVRAQDSKVNPCPASTTLTDWEAFVNHAHILDEFAKKEGVIEKHQTSELQDEWEVTYVETHPDFISACELG